MNWLIKDFKPANALEYRQLELIVRCDIDIDRQYRFITQHLNPLAESSNEGGQLLADWHKFALRKSHNPDDDDAGQAESTEDNLFHDERLTQMIAKRYAKRSELMSIHQREIAAAYRRSRQEVQMLNELQDRRRRKQVPDAVVVNNNV